MDPIPAPDVLDPDRIEHADRDDMTRDEHRNQGRLLARGLRDSCEYAQHLWRDLAAMRQYLFESLPPEPDEHHAPGGAAPHGPDDEQGWQRWSDAFAEVTSVLCGPRGDSGFGRSSAVVLARSRRTPVPVASSAPAPSVVDPTRPLDRALSGPSETGQVEVASGSGPSEVASGSERAESGSATVGALQAARPVVRPLGYVTLGAVLAMVARRLRAR